MYKDTFSLIRWYLITIAVLALFFAAQLPLRYRPHPVLRTIVLIIRILLIPASALLFVAIVSPFTYHFGNVLAAVYAALIADTAADIAEHVIRRIRCTVNGMTDSRSYYIISGTGILKTPGGEKEVHAGDLLFFPAGESGAHKLTNASDCEPLVYIDFDTIADPNVCVYPDSNKIGVYGKDLRKIYRLEDNVDYYDRE